MKSWTKYSTTGNGPTTSNTTAVLYGDHIYIFGGYFEQENTTSDQFYRFNLITKEWTERRPLRDEIWPEGRMGHSACIYDDKMYIFFGWERDCHDDIYSFDFAENQWTDVPWTSDSDSEIEKYYHQNAVWNDIIFIIFGCVHSTSERSRDIFEFHPSTGEFVQIPDRDNCPSGRSGTTSCIYNDTLYVFGGYAMDKSRYNDLHCLDLNTYQWKEMIAYGELPPRTSGQAGLFFDNALYIFGGSYGGGGTSYSSKDLTYVDTFSKFDLISSQWKRISSRSPPTKRSYCHAMFYYDEFIVYGGSDAHGVYNDLYSYKIGRNGFGSKCLVTEKYTDVIISTQGRL